MIITGVHVAGARTLLGRTPARIAGEFGKRGANRKLRSGQVGANRSDAFVFKRVLKRTGVEFIAASCGGAGVRLASGAKDA